MSRTGRPLAGRVELRRLAQHRPKPVGRTVGPRQSCETENDQKRGLDVQDHPDELIPIQITHMLTAQNARKQTPCAGLMPSGQMGGSCATPGRKLATIW